MSIVNIWNHIFQNQNNNFWSILCSKMEKDALCKEINDKFVDLQEAYKNGPADLFIQKMVQYIKPWRKPETFLKSA